MNHKSFFLSFAIVLMANSIKVLARSIDTSGSETPSMYYCNINILFIFKKYKMKLMN